MSRCLRLASQLLIGAAARLLGAKQVSWSRAMQAEVAAIGDEREALAYAWGCLTAALGHALAPTHLPTLTPTLTPTLAPMLARLAQPHTVGVLACSTSVLLGGVLTHLMGGPGRYLGMNLLSLALAVATFFLLPRRRLQRDNLLRAGLCCVMGALLLVCSLGGGVAAPSAWLSVGPVRLNLAWLLLPALLVGSEVGRQPAARRWAAAGLLMALGALALQADVLLAGLVVVVLSVRAWFQRRVGLALLAGLAAVVALHSGPAWHATAAQPFVDRVLQHGFEHHLATGLALTLLQLLPLWPALLQRPAREHGLVWGLLMALALPGCLPSALVGFGGSFIFGYLLSLALLPGESSQHPTQASGPDLARRWRSPPHLHRSGQA